MGVFVTKGGMKSPGSGRVKGTRNKISQAFLEALSKDFDEHGEAAIKIMRVEKPTEYCKVIASILPKEFEITENKLVEMDDSELDAVIEFARRSLERRTISIASREDETANGRAIELLPSVSEAEILS
jgi:SepF-like predicted cell division protein (DUF552 family)